MPAPQKYLYITGDGSLIPQASEPTETDFAQVEEGNLTIVRLEAGRFEQLTVESTTEEDEEAVIEGEEEVKWETAWEPL